MPSPTTPKAKPAPATLGQPAYRPIVLLRYNDRLPNPASQSRSHEWHLDWLDNEWAMEMMDVLEKTAAAFIEQKRAEIAAEAEDYE